MLYLDIGRGLTKYFFPQVCLNGSHERISEKESLHFYFTRVHEANRLGMNCCRP